MNRTAAAADAARAVVFLVLCASGCSTHERIDPRTPASGSLPVASPERAPDPRFGDAPSVVPEPSPPAVPPGARGVAIQRGRATYYADRFNGRPTASGERYDPREFTAAHRTLPFGAILDVVRRDGRRVRVRINDRGPFARGKIIDLSRRAAEAIGLVHDGTCDVTLELISRPPRK